MLNSFLIFCCLSTLAATDWNSLLGQVILLNPLTLIVLTTIGIDQVFWVYESLFNELDRLSTIAEQRANAHHKWLTALAPALRSLNVKLRKYYNKTAKACVYPNGVIFQPHGKLSLFKTYSWEEGDIDKYSQACRDKYVSEYEGISPVDVSPPNASPKRNFSQIDDDNEYE